jgi:hypothetical protein
MGDHFQAIVDPRVALEEAPHLANHLVTWLAGRGVISSMQDEEGGYPRGPEALSICLQPSPTDDRGFVPAPPPPLFFHLQVVIGRLTHPDNLGAFAPSSVACPKCGRELEEVDPDWMTAAQGWMAGDNESALGCPGCGGTAPVSGWVYRFGYGFGNLAFRFWNWPRLAPTFKAEVERELGHPVLLIGGRL